MRCRHCNKIIDLNMTESESYNFIHEIESCGTVILCIKCNEELVTPDSNIPLDPEVVVDRTEV